MAERRQPQEPNILNYVPWVLLLVVVITVYSLYKGGDPQGVQTRDTSQTVESTSTAGSRTGAQAKPAPPKGKEVEVLAQALNMRSTASKTPGNVIATLTKGTVLKLEEQSDGWLKVKSAEGRVGYIAYDEKFLRIK